MSSPINLKVLIYDPDFYGRHAINSYLAWDRRTRVVCLADQIEAIFDWLARRAEAEWPDVILLDTEGLPTAGALRGLMYRLRDTLPDVKVLVLEHTARLDFAVAALEAGAVGYFLRNDVGFQAAWSIIWSQTVDFAISAGVQKALTGSHAYVDTRLVEAKILPRQRDYPELTDRIRQAVQLCVVEGMSADLAADEMGVSTHTIRSYIKEGYRILEAADKNEYPPDMSAQERAFMRFTALDETQSNGSPAKDSPERPQG
jgi:DNA-binding NarL/FixJ family response regulator